MIRRPPRSTQSRSSAASDVYKRQEQENRLGDDVRRANLIGYCCLPSPDGVRRERERETKDDKARSKSQGAGSRDERHRQGYNRTRRDRNHGTEEGRNGRRGQRRDGFSPLKQPGPARAAGGRGENL